MRLDFEREGRNPNAFGLPRPSAVVAEGGGFVGDTRRGGSCNCETITLNPHGNGTHTECVGHVSTNRIAVADVLTDIIIPALIISVEPTNPTDTPDEEPRITAESLSCALPVSHSLSDSANSKIPPALIIRTLPNDPSKREALWSGNHPPFIEPSAMRLIRDAGVRHLLVDLPSVDPEQDEHLTSHRIFWGLPPTGPVEADPTDGRTITEMIFVPDEVADGLYDITIQIPPFALDAAPSRVLIVG